jgi:hypothetical protein
MLGCLQAEFPGANWTGSDRRAWRQNGGRCAGVMTRYEALFMRELVETNLCLCGYVTLRNWLTAYVAIIGDWIPGRGLNVMHHRPGTTVKVLSSFG